MSSCSSSTTAYPAINITTTSDAPSPKQSTKQSPKKIVIDISGSKLRPTMPHVDVKSINFVYIFGWQKVQAPGTPLTLQAHGIH